MEEKILILDFGGQYSMLIARRVREENVYSEIHPHNITLEEIKKIAPHGIILSGGPNSVYEEDAPHFDKNILKLGIPVLGICYGAQLIAHALGGSVQKATKSEYGETDIEIIKKTPLFADLEQNISVFMSHTDYIGKAPANFVITAKNPTTPICAMEDEKNKIYALQFHPEVLHTKDGKKIIHNFLKNISHTHGTWTIESFIEKTVTELRQKIGSEKAICAISGGVDSTVAALLLAKAIGKNLTTIFVDHGLLRKNESEEVEKVFQNRQNSEVNFIKIDARERFYQKLRGVTDPETKRKIIGEEFIRIFEEEAKKIGNITYLSQGTIYPDIIESGTKTSATIKSHHNVGGLPQNIDFKEIIEPLKLLFKDEVRKVGTELGLADRFTHRQPFPGPGLAIRIIGEITETKVKLLQEADAIFREEIEKLHLPKISQYFAVLTNLKTVGVMGDKRTYDYALVLRAVETDDFMTAKSVEIPFQALMHITRRIVNEVKGINRVLYDTTEKPPATIEWE